MSSRKPILSRPRTRLYDANYNIGESYYKPALDRLDRKYSGRPLTPPRPTAPLSDDISERHARIFGDEDLEFSRRRAEKHIREDNVFDSRGARISKAALLADKMENDFNEETAASIRRLRANKKYSIIDDPELESASSNLKTERMLDRSEKLLDSVGINSERNLSSRRHLKDETNRRALRVTFDQSQDAEDMTKWTPIEGNNVRARREEAIVAIRAKANEEVTSASSAAALRAKQTKERINDIEDEMAALAEKQAAREARISRLKKLVAETEAESADFEIRAERNARREKRAAIEY